MPTLVYKKSNKSQEVENGVISKEEIAAMFELETDSVSISSPSISNGHAMVAVGGLYHVINAVYYVDGTPKVTVKQTTSQKKEDLDTLAALNPDLDVGYLSSVLSSMQNDVSSTADFLLSNDVQLEHLNENALKTKMEEMGFSVNGLSRKEMLQKLRG